MKVDKQKLDNMYTALDSLHNTLSEILENPLPKHDGGNDDNLTYRYNSDTTSEIYNHEIHELKFIQYVLKCWKDGELCDLVLSKRFHVLGIDFDEDIGDKNG